MSIDDKPTLLEPPAAGNEVETLMGSLERQRAHSRGSAVAWTLLACERRLRPPR